MPFLFREGLVFMPGDKALFKPDEEHEGEPCIVTGFVSGEDNTLTGYTIVLLNSKKNLSCAIEELKLPPKNKEKGEH